MAMTYHLFKEPEAGLVAHTAATKAMVQRPLLNQWIGMWLEEMGSTLARVIFSQIHGEPLYLWLTRILDGGCDDEVARVSGAKPDGNPLHRLYDSEEHTHTCDRGSISHMMCSIAPTKSSANIPNAPDGLKMPWSTFNPLRASRPLECSTVLIGTW